MCSRLVCLAMLAWMLVPGARAQTAAPPPQEDELYLEITLNGDATGLIMRFTKGKTSGLRSAVQNLRDLELDPKLFGVDGREEFDLDEVRGLAYTYDAARQSIALRVSDELRAPVALSGRTVRKAAAASVTRGAVINYDAYSKLGPGTTLSLTNEVRYFAPSGVFSSTGVWNYSKELSQFIRFDSAWIHADPESLETWQVGDLISSSLTWSRSLRMGGLQWRKSFDLRPDLLTFPAATLAGSAVVPTSVSLYINGVRQVESAVPSGPFIINQVAGINGAGQATLVTRDAAGRAISTTVPLYVDTRLLAAGLTDYSVELGALRRDYGTRSFSYEHSPALSGSLRRGLNDYVTLETHGEAGSKVINGGAGVLLRLGQAGVVSASLAASGGNGGPLHRTIPAGLTDAAGGISNATIVVDADDTNGRGRQATLGYQYLSSRFSIDAAALRATERYSDLGTAEGGAGTRSSNRLSFNTSVFGQSLGLSLLSYRAPQLPPARIGAVSYSTALGRGMYFSLSGFRDFKDAKARGLYFSLSMSFGDRISASASRGRQNGSRNTNLTMTRTAAYEGGFGWGLQSLSNDGSTTRQGQLQYLGNYGQITGYMVDNASTRSTSVDMAGALVLMDGSIHAARQVGAGFALVSTDGVGGVPVLQENRPIGTTSPSGYLLVPNLNPYLNNQIAIDTSALPLDARIASTSQSVVPARLSGVLARFPVEQYEAASVVVHGADGKPLAAGTEVLHVESGNVTVLGFDGVAFVDHLEPLNHLRIMVAGTPCVVEFAYAKSKGSAAMPTLGPLVCRSVQ